MPTFGPATGPVGANPDAISIQNASGVLAQKSSSLSGPVITADFTTTSASLVDVTGMTFTLAATNNVSTVVEVTIAWTTSVASTGTLSLNSSATKEYAWIQTNGSAWSLVRNADLTGVGATTVQVALLHGQLSGTTSGVVTKIQASITGANTLTVKVGSTIYGEF